MNDRREGLSTADIAGQEPTVTRSDRTDDDSDRSFDELVSPDGPADDRPRDEAVVDDTASPVRSDAPVESGTTRTAPDRDPLTPDVDRSGDVDGSADADLPRDADVDRPADADLPRDVDVDAGTRSDGAPGVVTTDTAPSSTGPLLDSHDTEGFRARWTDVQIAFVDSPRQSVEQADALVADLMQHLAATFADERAGLEKQWDRGDDIPTDDLRTAFQRYRSFFERLLAT